MDPVLEDLANSRAATKYGISKTGYLRRVALAKRVCNPLWDQYNRTLEEKVILEWQKCDDDVKSGRQAKVSAADHGGDVRLASASKLSAARREGIESSPGRDHIDSAELTPMQVSAIRRTPTEANIRECASQLRQRTAAFVARDWQHVDRLARKFLETCKGVVENESYSDAFDLIATANLEMGNVSIALSASESCIATYYANANCHASKVKALIAAGRLNEAKRTYFIADRVLEEQLEVTQRKLRNTTNPSERDFYTSMLDQLHALGRLLNALRTRVASTQ